MKKKENHSQEVGINKQKEDIIERIIRRIYPNGTYKTGDYEKLLRILNEEIQEKGREN